MKIFLTLKGFFYQYRWRYILGLSWLVLVDVFQLIVPKLLGHFADSYNHGLLTPSLALRYSGLILLLAVATAVFRYLWRMYINGSARLLEHWLRERFFGHLLTLPASFYDHRKIGDLMALATNDINAVRMSLGMGIVMLTDSIFLTTGTILIMAGSIDPGLTLAALSPLPLMALAATRFGRLIHARFLQVQESFARLTERAQENVAGVRVVKSFTREEAENKRFESAGRQVVEKNLALAHLSGIFYPLVQLLAGISFLVALAYGGSLVLSGRLSLGDFVAFNSYLGMLTWPVMALGWVVNVLQRGAASLARLSATLEVIPATAGYETSTPGIALWLETPPLLAQMIASPVSQITGRLECRSLTFSYNSSTRPVLENISFVVESGETLAIVGRTGAGKSTLLALILRLYEPPPGTIFLDGKDILELPIDMLRQATGYVPQESLLFSDTIARNISFGQPGLNSGELTAVARAAHIYEEAMGFPCGLDTVVGERGVTLSGGQKQRVALARALARQPRVLLLDDCLSAVDVVTEAAILADLEKFSAGRTVIMVSHRLGAARKADKILVLDDGRVRELGTHSELLPKRGSYYRLYRQSLMQRQLT